LDDCQTRILNYFSYFSEIEDTFIRRRGKHLMLSPMDWALIESWKERGVPLHVALRGIEHAFDSHQSKQRKRSVKTLLYCQEEVEAQYAEWLETRVGSQEETPEETSAENKSPFPRDVVLAHLARSLDELTKLHHDRVHANEDELSEALARAAALLAEVRDDYETAATPDARKLEASLTGIDRMLDEAIRIVAGDELQVIDTEIDAQLKPYKRHMDKAAFEQTRDNLRRKRLREHFNVPRLSLFYLSL
jgi:hypothetical protein